MICAKCGKEFDEKKRSKIDLDFIDCGFKVYLNVCSDCGNKLFDKLIKTYDKWEDED